MSNWRRAPELIGRTAELTVLSDAIDAAAGGRRAVVLIGGEAGAGKTRLVTTCAAAADGKAVVLVGSCLGYADGGLPFAPILTALEFWTRDQPAGATTALAELDRLAPGIRDLISGAGSGHPDGTGQARAYSLVAGAIAAVGADRPVLMIVDDLQWADRTTLEFLDYLASRSVSQHLAIVGTYRDNELDREELGRWLAEMIRCRGATDLYLSPLDEHQTEAMVRRILDAPVDPDVVADVHRRSGGNPYLVEVLAQPNGHGAQSLPAGLTQALLTRWHQLAASARENLSLLAVLGRAVDRQTLLSIVETAGRDGADLDDALDEGVRRGLLTFSADDAFGFSHPLLSEVVAGTLLPGVRRRWHQAIAAVISELPGLPTGLRAADMAVHCAAAGDEVGAFRWSMASADHAVAVHGFAEASDHLEAALKRWDRVDDAAGLAGAGKAEILLRAVEMSALSGRTDRLARMATSAVATVDPARDPVRAGGLRAALFFDLCMTVQDPIVETLAREAIALTEGSDGVERAGAQAIEAVLLGMSGRAAEATTAAEGAVELARAAGDSRTLVRCLIFCGSGRVLAGGAGARDQLREALVLARPAGALLEIPAAHSWMAASFTREGDHDEAVRTLLAGWQECRVTGLDRGLGLQLLTYASRLLRERGRWAEAENVLAEMRAVPCQGITRLKLLLEEAQLAARLGRADEAREQLSAAGDIAALPFIQFAVPDHQMAEVEVATWDGRPADVLSHAVAGLAAIIVQDCGARLLMAGARAVGDLAVAARDRGAPKSFPAADWLQRLDGLRADLRIDPFGTGTPLGWEPTAAKATWDAELARAIAADDQADLWLAAETVWTSRGFPPDAAYAGVRAGEALIGEGRLREAAAPLRRAHEVATSIGAAPLLAMTSAAAAVARIPLERPLVLPPQASSPLDRLTPREREILTLVAAGRTNVEIGRALFISATTASVHVSNILRKMGVTDRYAAAAMTRRLAALNSRSD